ncbi:9964_t:CDS:1, partial [Gigaspora rosea]
TVPFFTDLWEVVSNLVHCRHVNLFGFIELFVEIPDVAQSVPFMVTIFWRFDFILTAY